MLKLRKTVSKLSISSSKPVSFSCPLVCIINTKVSNYNAHKGRQEKRRQRLPPRCPSSVRPIRKTSVLLFNRRSEMRLLLDNVCLMRVCSQIVRVIDIDQYFIPQALILKFNLGYYGNKSKIIWFPQDIIMRMICLYTLRRFA